MQRPETTNVHPGLLIDNHEQRSPFGLVYLAVDEPKGDLAQGENNTDSPKTDLHVRSYPDLHVRLYADSSSLNPTVECAKVRRARTAPGPSTTSTAFIRLCGSTASHTDSVLPATTTSRP